VLDSLKIDIIILDLDLPGLTGSDFLDVLRQRNVIIPPVIVVTSYVPVKRHLQRIVQAVLPKPFDVDDFLAIVLQLVPRRQLTKASEHEQPSGGGEAV
jgi:two-component system, response regulator YesN